MYCSQALFDAISHSGLPTKLVSKVRSQTSLGRSVVRASSYREVNSLVFPMVAYLGPYIACDPILLVKLTRLGKHYMTKVVSYGTPVIIL